MHRGSRTVTQEQPSGAPATFPFRAVCAAQPHRTPALVHHSHHYCGRVSTTFFKRLNEKASIESEIQTFSNSELVLQQNFCNICFFRRNLCCFIIIVFYSWNLEFDCKFTILRCVCRLVEESTWAGPDDSWQCVRAGDTEPFSFGARRGRAARAHSHQLHQLALRLDGWDPPDPVCVDRVGVYFRHLTHTVRA